MKGSKRLPWVVSFTLLFCLSMDFWTWDNPIEISLWGFPYWIWTFILIQLLLTITIYLFVKYYWKSNSDNKTN